MECELWGCTVHYEVAGTGLPILVLQGAGADHGVMMNFMEPIFAGREGWQRIYWDYPGLGKTRVAEWVKNQEDVLEILSGLVEAVIPGENFAVAGISYGGYLARGLVYRMQPRLNGVCLMAPLMGANNEPNDLPKFRVIQQDPEFVAALETDEKYLQFSLAVQTSEILEDIRLILGEANPESDEELLHRLFSEENRFFSFDPNALDESCQVPSLFLTGRFDSGCGYKAAFNLLEHYPRASFVVLDRSGHLVVAEQKALTIALVSEWLDRVEEYVCQGRPRF